MPDVPAAAFDGVAADALARELDLPAVHVFHAVTSTMDVAAALGDRGAVAGTLVLADAQTAGRGRAGKKWSSALGGGLWLTLLERPNDPEALAVLSLRVGLRIAGVLERWTTAAIHLKWPNDLLVSGRKLGGVLIEARWREQRLDWVAIGVGINFTAPAALPDATHLTNAPRRTVLAELIPALRAAASARGALSAQELAAFADRDYARGRGCVAPGVGVVLGIGEGGELLVQTEAGLQRYVSGSLELQ